MAKGKAKRDAAETKVLDHTAALVKRVWGFCNVLRDDGVGASEYLEQLTFLLFLKMVDEQDLEMPSEWNWQKLRAKSGSELKDYYEKLLDALSKKPGMLGQMFYQAKNNINTPARLAEVIKMIDDEVWTGMAVDLKGNIYEDILAKTAEDIKSGAGQYFTPRALISAIMNCLRPKPGEKFKDPATGTGGFFLKAHDYVIDHYADKMNVEQKRFLKFNTFSGNDIVPRTRRMCLMNMYLHGMGSLDGAVPVDIADSLLRSPTELVDIVGTNPPFGKKTSKVDIDDEGNETKERQIYNRNDFCCETSNKQLNFLQHILTMLKPTGRAAVVLPDNVLFEKGAGETIRKRLMETMELHTILRLPTGIFYKPGVKANVLFFDARPASKTAQTKEVWVYDYRTNIHHTLKSNPMKESDLAEFVKLYCAENRGKREETWDAVKNPEGRWRKFSYAEIIERDGTNLNFKWLKDDSATPGDYTVDELLDTMKASNEAATESVRRIASLLKGVDE